MKRTLKKKTLILFTLLFGKTKPEREGEEVRERGSERERRGRESAISSFIPQLPTRSNTRNSILGLVSGWQELSPAAPQGVH